MVIMMLLLLTFGTIGSLITLWCILHNLDVSEMLPVYRTRKKAVGAAFWGTYEGEETTPAQETIKLPKINFDQEALVVGSEMYAKGRAVKSANNRR